MSDGNQMTRADALREVQSEVATACKDAARDPGSVSLIAVSKPHAFDAIHTVDRPSIAEALAKEIDKQGRHPMLFVEINTGAEPQKAGVLPEDADAFVTACSAAYGLAIAGLMCIPPVAAAPG